MEHLLPHKNGKCPERKFDWENLFWSCGHCNGIKNNGKYDGGIMDCCKYDPEQYLSFQIKGSDERLKLLQTEMNLLYKQLEKMRISQDSKVTVRTLRSLLRRESAFAAFKRCYVREHAAEYPELQQYVALDT